MGMCPICDVMMRCPPHACLRWMMVIGDEDGCEVPFPKIQHDHETAWRLDRIDGPPQEGAGPAENTWDDRFV